MHHDSRRHAVEKLRRLVISISDAGVCDLVLNSNSKKLDISVIKNVGCGFLRNIKSLAMLL